MSRHGACQLWLGAIVMLLGSSALRAELLDRSLFIAGTRVAYKVVLPDHFDSAKTYPAVLAFGGGPQTMETVDAVIARYFRDQAEKRGYIVIAPAAPNGELFFEGGERIFPLFLDQMLMQYRIEGRKFHVAGPSNGGISSFEVAARNPGYFWSITAFPGLLRDMSAAHVQAIAAMCIHMFVGELDPMGWQEPMRLQASALRAAGLKASYTVEPGQPHRLETLAGPHASRLFDLFDQARHGCGP